MAVLKAGSYLYSSAPQVGYVGGGANPTPAYIDSIDSFPFSSSPFTATDAGELSVARGHGAGHASASDGFATGGIGPAPSTIQSTVDKFPFASPTVIVTDVGEIHTATYYGSTGESSQTEGFLSGGQQPAQVDQVQKFPFSASPFTGTDVGEITTTRQQLAGHQSLTNGYVSGGYGPPGVTIVDTINSYPFSSSPFTATDIGELSQGRYTVSGHSSSTEGFASAGASVSSPFTRVDTVDKFPFSAPPVAGTDVGELTAAKTFQSGLSSTTDGFTAGGTFPVYDVVDKFPFSSSPFTATDVGELSISKSGMMSQSANQEIQSNILLDTDTVPATYFSTSGTPGTNQYFAAGGTGLEYYPDSWAGKPHGFGLNNGYVFGGDGPVTKLDIERFPFTTPFATATDVGELPPAAGYWGAGQSSDTEGFSSGGFPASTDVVWKFSFSAPPITASDAGELSQARGGNSGQASQTDGYNSGGWAPAVTDRIDKFPFSASPFTATDVGELAAAADIPGGTSSNSDGYISGGATPTLLDTIQRFPFSSPFTTATDTGELLAAASDTVDNSSEDSAYVACAPPATPYGTQVVQSFPFSAPPITTTDAGDLNFNRYQQTGVSSNLNGYAVGSPVQIDKFPFSAPFVTASDAGDINTAMTKATGQWY